MNKGDKLPITFVEGEICDYELGVRGNDSYCYRHDLAPGSANIETLDDGSIVFTWVCPCGCGAVSFVGIAREKCPHRWEWNGDLVRPTLTPSLQQHSKCRWHGFVTNGEFVTV
ncbi:MAG TPA: DUF6527 family protein [Rhizomicrobium sp.]|nr:DUF6527 family protein [Rhizomicrobium sp.]